MSNTDSHFEETKPAPLQPLVDFEPAQDTQPSDYADWIPEVRAVVIDARQIESEAEALGAEWSLAMELDTADFGADVDWYEPTEYMTGDQDELTPEAQNVAVDAAAPAESSDARDSDTLDSERTAASGNTPGDIDLRAKKTVTDTKASTPGTPKPSVKRTDKLSSGSRRSNKGSR